MSSTLSAPQNSVTRTRGALITLLVLSDAEARRAALAIVVPLAAGQDVLELGQGMPHVDVLRSEREVSDEATVP